MFGKHAPGVTDVWAEYVERRAAQGFDPEAIARAVREERLGAKVASGNTTGLRGAIGTPEQVREYLRRYEEAGVDQVIFVMQAGHNEHEHIMESIELFGREVLPEFIERDAAAVAAKAKRMEPIVEAAMARRAAITTPHDIGDYTFGAIPRQWAEATHDQDIEKWLEKFADDRAAGKRDESAGIAG